MRPMRRQTHRTRGHLAQADGRAVRGYSRMARPGSLLGRVVVRSDALHEVTGADTADADAERADTDAGHRTSTPGHWKAGAWTSHARTPGTGHRRGGRLDTHRTPDTRRTDAGHADVDRATKATVGIRSSGPPRRADGLLDGEPCCCGRHTRHSSDMTAWRVRPHASARDCPLRHPGSYSVAPPAAKRRRPRRIALVCWIWMIRGEGNGTTER
jgi:hypothetical protein